MVVTVPEVIEDFRRYVSQPDQPDVTPGLFFSSGGSLHIVLDDYNVDDHHVQFCIDHATSRGDGEGRRLGEVLLSMTKTQRLEIAKSCWKPA